MIPSLKVKLLEAQLRMKEWETIYGRTDEYFKQFADFNILIEKIRSEQSARKEMPF